MINLVKNYSIMKKHFDSITVPSFYSGARWSWQAGLKWMVGLLLLLVLVGGCQSNSKKPASNGTTQASRLKGTVDINPLKLKYEITTFLDASLAACLATYTDIAAQYPERHIREHCLRWKMRTLDLYLAMLAIEDPRATFLLTWTAIVNKRQFITVGPGKDNLGQAQPQIAALIKSLEADIVALGYRHFPREIMDAAKGEIEESALEFLWDSLITQDTALAEARDDADLMGILQLPLRPISNLGSIGKLGNTPKAINRFTSTADDFSLVIRYLPERMRWQMQMLLLEMESSGPTVAVVKQIQNVEQRVQDLIALFKAMPADMRKEFEKSIEATEKSLPEFRATLTEARAVAEKINAAIENANKTTLQAQETAVLFTESAKAFEAAAVEVRGLLADYRQWRNPEEPNEPAYSDSQRDQDPPQQQDQADSQDARQSDSEEEKKVGSGAKDYEQMAESIQAAAQEVRTLVDELQQPVEDEGTLRQVAGEFRGLIRTIFWYAVALAGIIFGLALTYRVTTRRLIQNQ